MRPYVSFEKLHTFGRSWDEVFCSGNRLGSSANPVIMSIPWAEMAIMAIFHQKWPARIFNCLGVEVQTRQICEVAKK